MITWSDAFKFHAAQFLLGLGEIVVVGALILVGAIVYFRITRPKL